MNAISTVTVSAAPYVSPVAGALTIVARLTVGTVAVAPFTLWPTALAIACMPKPRVADAPKLLPSVPPFRASALAPMPMPSLSASADCTTYPKTRVRVPPPLRYAAWRVWAPIVSASCGAPVTSTAMSKPTVTSIRSPAP